MIAFQRVQVRLLPWSFVDCQQDMLMFVMVWLKQEKKVDDVDVCDGV